MTPDAPSPPPAMSAAPVPVPGLGGAPPGGGPLAPASQDDVRASAWFWLRIAAIAVTFFVGYQLLLVVGGFLGALLTIVLYVVFGAIIALILEPLVNLLHNVLRLPRTLAILVALVGGIAGLSFVIYLAIGPTIDQAHQLADQVPDLVNRANGELTSLRSQLTSKGIDASGLNVSGSSGGVSSSVRDILLSSVTGTVRTIGDLVITLVVAFWLLRDGELLREGLLAILPGRLRVNVEFGLDAVGVVIGGYVRAQLFLAAIIGTLAGVGCAVIGVPFPIVVAVAAFVFELVPIVGPFVGGAVAILLALTVGVNTAFLTLLLFIGIHILEGYVLGPRIQAKFVQLHPVVSLLALFAGIDVGGFLGALFAIPLASLAAVFVRAAVGDIRASNPELYALKRSDLFSERRRASILGEFRLFKRSPASMVRAAIRRQPPPPVTEGAGAAPVAGIDGSASEILSKRELEETN